MAVIEKIVLLLTVPKRRGQVLPEPRGGARGVGGGVGGVGVGG